ncbi:hypothetical protein MA16_Dca017317 [Dendrobium catenatum]|uniref:Uncharacterized protein n=1 Tax=Dendrobium catenatum TaxID=906689 RepID=A0A2I0XG55_9ASPA|nr:hypothetical protein MA16_Dca017317 [Dendrobium catenatum]
MRLRVRLERLQLSIKQVVKLLYRKLLSEVADYPGSNSHWPSQPTATLQAPASRMVIMVDVLSKGRESCYKVSVPSMISRISIVRLGTPSILAWRRRRIRSQRRWRPSAFYSRPNARVPETNSARVVAPLGHRCYQPFCFLKQENFPNF